MKMIKRLAAVSVCLCLAAVLSACLGQGAAEKSTKAATETISGAQEEKVKIGISIYRYQDNFMQLYRTELKRYLQESYHADVVMTDAGGDQKRQNAQVKSLIDQGCDALILNLVKPGEAELIADQCKQAGVPVVFINREPKASEIERWRKEEITASYVGTDSRQAGIYQGEIILETPDMGDINGDGTVSYAMIMGDLGSADTRYRTEYAIKALEEGGIKTKNLFQQYGNWEEERGNVLVTRAQARYGSQLEVVFCNNDAMANGAMEALEQAGRHVGTDIYLVGVDALEETVGYVKDGRMTGTVLNDHVGQSHTAADVVMQMIDGKKTELRYDIDYVKITMVDMLSQPETNK